MQRIILKNKNSIMILSAILIASGFIAKFVFNDNFIFQLSFIIASIISVSPIAIQAFQALLVKVVSIDLLVTIAVAGAFVIKNYEESAIVTFLFLFGGFLEEKTLNKTRSAIKSLTEMAPETALKQNENGEFEEVDVDDVNVGDVLLVKTGAKIPVDGNVIVGEGLVNEASITGESIAVTKEKDSRVFAGTILENGTIQILATRVGEDTTFGKIIELVEEAQDAKSNAERFIDRFAKHYTPFVLLAAIVTYVFTKNIETAVTILVLGCPGALVVGIPVSNVAGIGNGARNGVLLKGSEIIHSFSKTDSFVFDKTGTLTIGKPEVSSAIYIDNDVNAKSYLASIEKESNHPLASAVLNELGNIATMEVESTEVVKGKGVVAIVDNSKVAVGNLALMEKEKVSINKEDLTEIQKLEKEGNSIVLCSVNGKLKIIMGIKDQIRNEIQESLIRLKRMGVKNLIMLSGDNQGTVDAVVNEINGEKKLITEAIGNMLPEDKSEYVKKLKNKGQTVTFVGDGINDSPSLALADIGIAMGGGTDVAIETSDVVLMNSDFSKLPKALGLAKATSANMIQNVVIALGTVVFLISALFFSTWMNMSIGMLLHEGSVLVVILNGMRLLRYKGSLKKSFSF